MMEHRECVKKLPASAKAKAKSSAKAKAAVKKTSAKAKAAVKKTLGKAKAESSGNARVDAAEAPDAEVVEAILKVIVSVAAEHTPELTICGADAIAVAMQVRVRGSIQRGSKIYQVMLKDSTDKQVAWTQATNNIFGETGAKVMAIALSQLAEQGYSKEALKRCKDVAQQDPTLEKFWDLASDY